MDLITNSENGLEKCNFPNDALTWWPELGMGFYPVKQQDWPYDRAYFDKYRQDRDTPIGRALNKARVDMVARHYHGAVVDFGIGDGAFITARGASTYGYDVNPAGIEWLQEQRKYIDYYSHKHEAVSFWDALEHVYDIEGTVSHIVKYAFVSIPIFHSGEHCYMSKHYRKDQHVWYFTTKGIIDWFDRQGFDCVEANTEETKIGREDIGSFVFRRRDK